MIKTYGGNTVECFRHNLEPYSVDCFDNPVLKGKTGTKFDLSFKILEISEDLARKRVFRQNVYSTPGEQENDPDLAKTCVKKSKPETDVIKFEVTLPAKSAFEDGYGALVLFTDEPETETGQRFLSVFAHFVLMVFE